MSDFRADSCGKSILSPSVCWTTSVSRLDEMPRCTCSLFSAVLTTPADGHAAAEIAVACTHSFRTGKIVYFGDDGKPILE
jgi:hypothetical protein